MKDKKQQLYAHTIAGMWGCVLAGILFLSLSNVPIALSAMSVESSSLKLDRFGVCEAKRVFVNPVSQLGSCEVSKDTCEKSSNGPFVFSSRHEDRLNGHGCDCRCLP